jgi:hypothetical protein
MNRNIELNKEELVNKTIELDKEKKWLMIGSGYILKKDLNTNSNYKTIDLMNLIGQSSIDDIFASKIKLVANSKEENLDYHYIFDIFYNIDIDDYELKLYKHSNRTYSYKTTWKNESVEHKSSEIYLENIDNYKLKVFSREEDKIHFVFLNIIDESTILVLSTQVADL